MEESNSAPRNVSIEPSLLQSPLPSPGEEVFGSNDSYRESFTENAPVNPSRNDSANAAYASEMPISNGAKTNGVKPPDPSSLFWQSPLSGEEEIEWFVPPLPLREEHGGEVVEHLQKLQGMMQGSPKRAWLLHWDYLTRTSSSAKEHIEVERESEIRFKETIRRAREEAQRLDGAIEGLRVREEEVRSDLEVAQKQFAEAAATAGLSVETHPKVSEPKTAQIDKDAHDDLRSFRSGINTQSVEEALQNEVPDLEAVAGEHGVSPIPKQTIWGTILTFFMQFLAPVICGFMLALSLGTLVGILDVDDFQRRDSMPKFALSAALGFVIVYLMGEIFTHAIHSLTRSLEERGEEENSTTVRRRFSAPKVKKSMEIAIALMAGALFLGFAEVIAEANGIKELHHQQIARRERFRSPDSNVPREEEQPFVVYLIIGTLISGPYLLYKTAKSWGESELHLREAWLHYQQRTWIDERRERKETGLAFQLACRVEQLENNLFEVRNDLKRQEAKRAALQNPEPDKGMQSRRKEARAAAVGEALRLQNIIEEIVESTEPLPSNRQSPVPISLPRSQSGSRRDNAG